MNLEYHSKVYLYRRIVKSKIFIDENYSLNIDVNNIAEESYFSKFHFIRIFKSVFKKTPFKYLTFVRIEKAKLLLQTNITISEVCFSVGFQSISSFSGLFKRITGLTPTTYQKQQLQIRRETQKKPLKFVPNCYINMNGWQNSNFEEVQT